MEAVLHQKRIPQKTQWRMPLKEKKKKHYLNRLKRLDLFLFQQVPSLEVHEHTKKKNTAHSYILTLNDRRLPVYLEAKTG